MAFELGFLVGSLALLGLVVYITRFRGPSLPHERMDEVSEGGTASADRGGTRPGTASAERVGTADQCELCGERRATKSVNDLAVCAKCDEDLLT